MTIEFDRAEFTVTCNYCDAVEIFDPFGFIFTDVKDEMRHQGWAVKARGKHYCPTCAKFDFVTVQHDQSKRTTITKHKDGGVW